MIIHWNEDPFLMWARCVDFCFVFCCCLSERFVMYDGYPYSVSGKMIQTFWGRKKCRSPPPPPLFFRTFFPAGGGPIKNPVCPPWSGSDWHPWKRADTVGQNATKVHFNLFLRVWLWEITLCMVDMYIQYFPLEFIKIWKR